MSCFNYFYTKLMTNYLNTHTYDGKLANKYSILIKKDIDRKQLPLFTVVLQQIENKTPKAIPLNKVQKVRKLVLRDRKANIDTLNNINFEELLCRTWRLITRITIDKSIIHGFYEQFIGILNGSCP